MSDSSAEGGSPSPARTPPSPERIPPTQALFLSTIVWSGQCFDYCRQGGLDHPDVGTYSQQDGASPLRLVGWSDQHYAWTFEPLTAVQFRYTRRDVIGRFSPPWKYDSIFVGEPKDHGPCFALHAAGVHPFPSQTYKFDVWDYEAKYRRDPTVVFRDFPMLPIPDVAAEVAAVGQEELPAFVQAFQLLDLGKPEGSYLRKGLSGPWARALIDQARQQPQPPLGTMTTIVWSPQVWESCFGVEVDLETIEIHSNELATREDLPAYSPVRSIPVIDRYTIRATVRRVYVRASYFPPESAEENASGEEFFDAQDHFDEDLEGDRVHEPEGGHDHGN